MDRELIVKKIIKIIEEEFDSVLIESADANLLESGLNSVDLIQLIILIEEGFGFEFPDEDLVIENFRSVNILSEYISEKIEVNKWDIYYMEL